MLGSFPKDDARFHWTRHIKNKMLFYGLSASRLKRILKSPDRIEEGIAEGTLAVMKASKTKKGTEEIWIMYVQQQKKESESKLRSPRPLTMVSAWRYPGVSKPGDKIPIPDDLLDEIRVELSRLL